MTQEANVLANAMPGASRWRRYISQGIHGALSRVVIAGVWLYSGLHFLHGAFWHRGYGDFFLILNSVRSWRGTGQLWVETGAYPPLHTLLMYPLAPLSDEAVIVIMHVVNAASLALVVGLVILSVPAPLRARWLLLAGPLVLNYRPLLYTLSMIKIEMLELAVIAAALHAFRRRRDGLAGALLVAGALVKFVPGMLVAYFFWKREWRVIRGAAIGAVLLVGVNVAVFGVKANVAYYVNHFVDPLPLSWLDNQSWSAAVSRLFAAFPPDNAFPQVPIDRVTRGVIVTGMLAVLGFLLVVSAGRLRCREGSQLDYETCLWLTAFPVLSTFYRDYYAVYLLPAYLFLLRMATGPSTKGVRIGVGLGGVSYVLVGQGFPLGVIGYLPAMAPGVSNLELFLHVSTPFWGYLVLMAACAVAWHARRDSSAQRAACDMAVERR